MNAPSAPDLVSLQFYAVRRKLTEEFPDGKVDIKIALPVRQRIF